MTAYAQEIAGNVVLQAISIIVTLVGAALFLWSNRKPFINLSAALLKTITRTVWVPDEITMRDRRLGSSNPSYFTAVIARHVVLIFGLTLLYFMARGTIDALAEIKPRNDLLNYTIAASRVLVNVLSLIVGARMGEIWRLSSLVIADAERQQQQGAQK